MNLDVQLPTTSSVLKSESDTDRDEESVARLFLARET